jgi:hypothetical protein
MKENKAMGESKTKRNKKLVRNCAPFFARPSSPLMMFGNTYCSASAPVVQCATILLLFLYAISIPTTSTVTIAAGFIQCKLF